MFYYDGNHEGFEADLEQYMAFNSKDTEKADYKIGSGWPNYTLADLEYATGLDGREYGFDPKRIVQNLQNEEIVEVILPKFEMAAIKIGTGEINSHSKDIYAESFEKEDCDCFSQNGEIQALHICAMDIFYADMEYMKNLSGEINRRIQPSVDQALNEFAYEGSPVMNENPESEFVQQLVRLAMEKAADSIDEVGVIMAEAGAQEASWNRYRLLHGLFESAVLKELFSIRRPKYRRILGW